MTQTNYPKTYAATYDRQLQEKPTFLRLRQQITKQAKSWNISLGDIIAHIGEDTGHFSLGMAALHPQACVVHISDDVEMNDLTEEKQLQSALSNHRILELPLFKLDVENESLKAVVSIHLLNTFPNSVELIKKIETWLEAGGYFLFTTPPSFSLSSPYKIKQSNHQLCSILTSTKLELIFQQQLGICAGEIFIFRKN